MQNILKYRSHITSQCYVNTEAALFNMLPEYTPLLISISSGLSLKHIPIITGKFVLAIHWIGGSYQIPAHSSVSTKPRGSVSLRRDCCCTKPNLSHRDLFEVLVGDCLLIRKTNSVKTHGLIKFLQGVIFTFCHSDSRSRQMCQCQRNVPQETKTTVLVELGPI